MRRTIAIMQYHLKIKMQQLVKSELVVYNSIQQISKNFLTTNTIMKALSKTENNMRCFCA